MSNPLCDLLVAMAKQAHKDIERVKRLGDKATPQEIAVWQSAERFLEECRRELAQT